MRERWFGNTGRRVPELALEGTLELEDALVLDGVEDEAALREAHAAGQAGRRAGGDTGGREGGARPARGRVGARAHRGAARLDLTELTYG